MRYAVQCTFAQSVLTTLRPLGLVSAEDKIHLNDQRVLHTDSSGPGIA
jgi:hypothetical protein